MNEKQKLIAMLDEILDKFDVRSKEDEDNVILLLTNMLIMGENDPDVIEKVRAIVEKATNYNRFQNKRQGNDECCFDNDRDDEQNFIRGFDMQYYKLPRNIREMMSYRVLCPKGRMGYRTARNDD